MPKTKTFIHPKVIIFFLITSIFLIGSWYLISPLIFTKADINVIDVGSSRGETNKVCVDQPVKWCTKPPCKTKRVCTVVRFSPPPSPTSTPTAIAPITIPSPISVPGPVAPPVDCASQVMRHYAFSEICGHDGDVTSYRYIDYTCGDETTPRRYGDSGNCMLEHDLKSNAASTCRQLSCP